MSDRNGVFYRLDLTPHERSALLSVLGDYIPRDDAIEVSIDSVTGKELEIPVLLAKVIDAQPINHTAVGQLAMLEEAQREGWTLDTDPDRIRMLYKDFDIAQTVPKVLTYYHMGVLLAALGQAEAELAKRRK